MFQCYAACDGPKDWADELLPVNDGVFGIGSARLAASAWFLLSRGSSFGETEGWRCGVRLGFCLAYFAQGVKMLINGGFRGVWR